MKEMVQKNNYKVANFINSEGTAVFLSWWPRLTTHRSEQGRTDEMDARRIKKQRKGDDCMKGREEKGGVVKQRGVVVVLLIL